MDTARKILKDDVLLLDELQSHLSRRGIKTSQKALISEGIKLLAENEDKVVERLKKKDNTKEMTERFLKNAGKYDFGPNWLEEIDTTL